MTNKEKQIAFAKKMKARSDEIKEEALTPAQLYRREYWKTHKPKRK